MSRLQKYMVLVGLLTKFGQKWQKKMEEQNFGPQNYATLNLLAKFHLILPET